MTRVLLLAAFLPSGSAFGIDWKIGHFASITRSSKAVVTAQIKGFSGQYAEMHFRVNDGAFNKKVPIRQLRPPEFQIGGVQRNPTFSFILNGQPIILDRLGRLQGEKGPALVPLEVLPIPPWKVGQIVRFHKAKEPPTTARIVHLSEGTVTVEWRKNNNLFSDKLKMDEVWDPVAEEEGTKLFVQVGDEKIYFDQNGIDIKGDFVVAAAIVRRSPPSLKSSQTPELLEAESLPVEKEDLSPELHASGKLMKAELNLLRGFPPVRKLQRGDFTFYFSRPFKAGGRHTYALMYSQFGDGRVLRRVLYKSLSDGGWRSPPAIGGRFGPGHLWKGNYLKPEDSHYTQETKTIPEIDQALLELERAGTMLEKNYDFMSYFSVERLLADGAFTYGDEILYFQDDEGVLHSFQKYKPGTNLRDATQFEKKRKFEDLSFRAATVIGNVPDLHAYMQSLVTEEMMGPGKFIPDFKQAPSREYMMNHALLSRGLDSDIQVRVYDGVLAGSLVEWHMANDLDGRIWIARNIPKTAKVNSYGILNRVIDSGALTNKPLEYVEQIPGNNLLQVKEFVKGYVDITPFLDDLLPIQKYREQWKIPTLESLPSLPKRQRSVGVPIF